MRELQVCPPSKRRPVEVVYRLEFSADGGELVAWIGWGIHAYDLRTDTARALFTEDNLRHWDEVLDHLPDLVVSADRQFVVFGYDFDGDAAVHFENLSDPNSERDWFPDMSTSSFGRLNLALTADGKDLIIVRNHWDEYRPSVARFDMTALTAPPKRYRPRRNRSTGKTEQYPVRNLKCKHVLDLPEGESTTIAAVSANGRFVAAGTEEGRVHVADLKKKEVLASFKKVGRLVSDNDITRVGFDPAGEWVLSVANGRLFARPLGAGKAWQTKTTLGRVNDFAFHPDGRVLCAVFADGQARFLDPRTGAVRQSFKWLKKSRPLCSVAFAPDGLTCAVGAEKGKVIVWDVDV